MTLVVGAVAVVVLLGIWVLRPLLGRGRRPIAPADTRRAELLETKHAVYRSILDLELDRELGKVAQADYQELRREHEEEALGLLRELDEEGALAGTGPQDPGGLNGTDGSGSGDDALDVLEREIAAARQRRSGR